MCGFSVSLVGPGLRGFLLVLCEGDQGETAPLLLPGLHHFPPEPLCRDTVGNGGGTGCEIRQDCSRCSPLPCRRSILGFLPGWLHCRRRAAGQPPSPPPCGPGCEPRRARAGLPLLEPLYRVPSVLRVAGAGDRNALDHRDSACRLQTRRQHDERGDRGRAAVLLQGGAVLEAGPAHGGRHAGRVRPHLQHRPQQLPEVPAEVPAGHLTDQHLAEFLRRCQRGLRPNGLIVIKDNMAQEGVILDDVDSSVCRGLEVVRRIVHSAGLRLLAEERQENLPDEIYHVYSLALR
ncbi:PREDICTED: N-terminal Xaa-Pro-Lys N-methyltransferase 1 isoform X2 [Chinchilla lanigera]|uniref:N-terminal Xaa-Pro-Lys N-methyltransferase 1 isoform X2 n=1 Tax=Chinchilla lanigera TaxID=34839 RepID=UPI00038EDE89|nr:PREDICTED: N-terminal Xaa-Pro-Lys N-methyltransferase 1 isoform X2 [Chinchilla lanigera]